jgi:hypothetical protein
LELADEDPNLLLVIKVPPTEFLNVHLERDGKSATTSIARV